MDGSCDLEDDKSLLSSNSGSPPQILVGACERFFARDIDSSGSEIGDSAIVNTISMQLQQQLFEDDMELMFSKDLVQQLGFEEFLPSEAQWHPSSSSSSQPSLLTVGSPESSCLRFPSMKTDDMEITKAISAIFSSTSSSMSDQSMRQTNIQSLETCQSGFKRYNSMIPPTFEPKKRPCGQKMIKDSISYLRKIDSTKDGASYQEGPSGQQLIHMISERKRREKLNGSFYELRLLLPPSSKKDKASVLCKTKDYLKTLEAQIFEFKHKNQMLEMHLLPKGEPKQDANRPICGKNVQIIEATEPAIGIRRIKLKLTVSIECDLLELVLYALEYLKEARAIGLVSIDANSYLQHAVQFSWATIKFDIKAVDWDEVSFKKGMIEAVDIMTLSS